MNRLSIVLRFMVLIACTTIASNSFGVQEETQGSSQRSTSQTKPNPSESSGRNQSLEADLQRLTEATAQLRSQLATPANAGPASNTNQERGAGFDRDQTLRDINMRIDLLKKVYSEKTAAPPLNPTQNSGAKQPLVPPKDPNKTQPNGSVPVESMMNFANTETNPGSPNPIGVSPNGQVEMTPVSAERVLPQPVDAFEMGNSLFQTGNLDAAMKAYESVDRGKVTASESVWLDFMTACCHRRLGEPGKAEAIYRQLVNEANSKFLLDPSEAWLNYLKTKGDFSLGFEQLDLEIDSLVKQAMKHVER